MCKYGGHNTEIEVYPGLIISCGGWLPAEPEVMVLPGFLYRNSAMVFVLVKWTFTWTFIGTLLPSHLDFGVAREIDSGGCGRICYARRRFASIFLSLLSLSILFCLFSFSLSLSLFWFSISYRRVSSTSTNHGEEHGKL